tara:strand:+ start:7037 stop:7858 length:822 start_codon:yes stop_codon:yes gene_type:complete
MSINENCSDCVDLGEVSNHIFIPIYLDSSGVVLDSSANVVSTLDASYNFILDSFQTQANYLRSMIYYSKNGDDYTFKYNDINKILLSNSLKYDLENTYISMHSGTFNSGNTPSTNILSKTYIQYIADTLIGHPMSQAFISNKQAIIDKLHASNIHIQFINAMTNNLTTNSLNNNDICKSILLQMKENMYYRFHNEDDNVEYPLPFCPGDYITLFIKMKCDIELDNNVGETFTENSQYDILKSMFENKEGISFDDNNKTMKLIENIWRIKLKLL